MRILAIEDTPEYQKIISRALSDYDVTCVGTADEALAALDADEYALVIVDINLPDRDGYLLMSEIRGVAHLSEIPILCLTGRAAITDKVTAFSLGADDYLTKPFDPIELKARIAAKLKKVDRRKTNEQKTVVGPLEIDHERHRVMARFGSQTSEISVTPTEFKILSCLARRPDQVFTRDQILVAAWGHDATVLDRVVDSHICSLRKKMGALGPSIRSIPGVGYKMIKRVAHPEATP